MQNGSVKNQNFFSKKILSNFFGRLHWNLLWLIKNFESGKITKTIHDFFVVLEDGKKWSFDAVSHAVNVFESAFMN